MKLCLAHSYFSQQLGGGKTLVGVNIYYEREREREREGGERAGQERN